MQTRTLFIAMLLLLGSVAHAGSEKKEGPSNPRIVREKDPKLGAEFDYLIYDLGNGVELKLIKVPAKGKTFVIGSPKDEKGHQSNEEQCEITLAQDYFLGVFEVTRGQFRRFVEAARYKTEVEVRTGGWGWNEDLKQLEGFDKKYNWSNAGFPQTDEHPVLNISWADAKKFCEWLGKKGDGKIAIRLVRLPGEAEWEYACRAGSKGRFFFGENEEDFALYGNIADGTLSASVPILNIVPKGDSARPGILYTDRYAIKAKDGYAFTAPVGSFRPNAFGLYDMQGNAWEWCEDWHGNYADLPREDNHIRHVQPANGLHVIRGGSWSYKPQTGRCAARSVVPAESRGLYGFGFRVAVVPSE